MHSTLLYGGDTAKLLHAKGLAVPSSPYIVFAISNITKKNWCTKKIPGGGGGGGVLNFFFRKTILSHFMFYAIFNIKKKY